MYSQAAAASASSLSRTMYSAAPPIVALGVSLGPGIGPTPMSSDVIPAIAPPSTKASTPPSAPDEAIVIAAGCSGSAIRSSPSIPLRILADVHGEPVVDEVLGERQHVRPPPAC